MQSVRSKIKPTRELVKQYSGQYKTSGEYADALRSWMLQLYQVQCIHSSFPLFLANLQAQSLQSSSTAQTPNTETTTTTTTGANVNQQPQPRPQQTTQEPPRQGREYALPSVMKRFLAEVIDFLLLFIIKLGVTYVAVDSFELLDDLDKYDLHTLSTDILSDYKLAMNVTSDLLFLEMMHRMGTCLFEALCLQRGPGGVGGATPGKWIMGLRVVRCEFAAPAVGDRVVVYPSSNLGFGRAIIRSILKNLSMTFLFPICFTMFTFQHNRTIYDIFAGSIVVEDHRRIEPQNNNN